MSSESSVRVSYLGCLPAVLAFLLVVACCCGVNVDGKQVFGCSTENGLEFRTP